MTRASVSRDVRDRDALTWGLHTLLVGVLIWRHEPWRDELQAWSIALASKNPLDLFPNTRLEGRPPGWQILLWPFAQATSSPRMMQLVAFVIGSIAAWWWLRRTSLHWRVKALMLFGFLFTGGYLVHARDYVLSLLVLVAATAVYERRGAGLHLAAVLCVLSFVNAFSLAMAAAFVAAVWLPEILRLLQADRQRRLEVLGGLLLCAGWFAWAGYLTYPSSENQFQVGKYKGFGRALTQSVINVDYSNVFMQRVDNFIALALMIAALMYMWMHSRVAFAFVGLSLSMLMYNLTYGYGDYWWHFGNAFIVIAVGTCFPRRIAEPSQQLGTSGVKRVVQFVGVMGVTLIALVNFAANWYGAGKDVYSSRPYSMTAAAASQLREICDGCTIIVDWDAIGAGISAQLGGREIYYLNRSEFGTFAKFSNKNIAPTWDDAIAAMARFDKPLLVRTAFLPDPAPAEFELVGIHLDGVHDHNLIWQSGNKRVLPDD